MITYAMGGAMHSKGLPGREPMKYGTHVTLYQSGIVGALATMTALFSRERNGQGEHVDISIFETAAHSRDARSPDVIAAQFINAVKPRRTPGSTMGTGTFPCKDGYIVFSGGGARFSQTVAMIGKPEFWRISKVFRHRNEVPMAIKELAGPILAKCQFSFSDLLLYDGIGHHTSGASRSY